MKLSDHKLTLGQSIKVPHCGTDRSAHLTRESWGYRLYCHRCQTTETEKVEVGLKDFMAQKTRENAGEAARQSLSTPRGLPLHDVRVPPKALLWTLKAGISAEEAAGVLSMRYSDTLERVVVPIRRNGNIVPGWQGRALPGVRPKYMMPKKLKQPVFFMKLDWTVPQLVLVEDILSAYRLHKAGINAAAILGTSLTWTDLDQFEGMQLIGWFDNDKAGDKAFVKLRSACKLVGQQPRRIRSEYDPKVYSLKEIREHVALVG